MEEKIDRIVLSIPHCSTQIDLDEWDSDEIMHDVYKWTDLYADIIFQPDIQYFKSNIFLVKGNVSRFICDVERLENDSLNEIGQGIIYTRFGKYNRNITHERKQEIMNTYYYPYIENLKSSLTPSSLLIDCHSFPYEVNNEIDINLGFNKNWSKPDDKLIHLIADYFEKNGLKVGLNIPYSNSISPECHFKYKSIMIELNKKLYLNSDYTLKAEADQLNKKLTGLYRLILQK
jgi:N-formylglutamate amidohydrolase